MQLAKVVLYEKLDSTSESSAGKVCQRDTCMVTAQIFIYNILQETYKILDLCVEANTGWDRWTLSIVQPRIIVNNCSIKVQRSFTCTKVGLLATTSVLKF